MFWRDKYQVGNTEFVNSFYVTIRYHLGTISAGSLIITILSIIRAAAELARDNVDDASVAIVILYYCLLCCVACIEEIADYLAKKAYIITGATRDTFSRAKSRPSKLCTERGC